MKPLIRRIVYGILTTFMDREKLIWLLSKKKERDLLSFKYGGFLYDIGWVNSMDTNSVVDLNNKPLPWVTYPFIFFIQPRLQKKFDIFEFGSGNSTLYYADKVGHIDSVEHDAEWYDKICGVMPQNVALYHCSLQPGGDYSRWALNSRKKYNMIIVDGRDRVNCCYQSIGALNDDGVLVLDDAERERYSPALEFMERSGFKKIEFWGMAPVINYLKCTAIFYRDNNCLAI